MGKDNTKDDNISLNTGVISAEESKLIEQLKENVKDVLPPNILAKSEEDQRLYFVRWIRARENNLEKATDMLKNHLQWRIERNADNALNFELHPFFPENYPYYYAGVDKIGQPVICIPLATWDLRKVVNDAERLKEFDDYMTHMFEVTTDKITKEHEKRTVGQSPITQVLFLLDVKNYPYGQLVRYSAVKKILHVGRIYEAHYPEILYRAIFINCPSYFGMFLNLLKSVMAPKTIGKLACYSDMAKWQEEIGELVDPSIVPERYGGTLKNP